MKGLLKRELGHGIRPPFGWRFAWYEPRRRLGVYYPAPLHRVARTCREIGYRFGLAWRAPTLEQREVFDLQRRYREKQKLAAEYSRGYLCGWQECFDQWVEALDQVTEDLLRN